MLPSRFFTTGLFHIRLNHNGPLALDHGMPTHLTQPTFLPPHPVCTGYPLLSNPQKLQDHIFVGGNTGNLPRNKG